MSARHLCVQWQDQCARDERDKVAGPDQVKIAVLLNETIGPLQQHLQLLAGTSQTYTEIRSTIIEYYRTATAFSRMQQAQSSSVSTNFGGGTAPMDIGAKKGKGNYKGKTRYGNRYCPNYGNSGRGKGYSGAYKGGQGRSTYKGMKGVKGKIHKGKGPIGHAHGGGYRNHHNTPQQAGAKGKSKHKGKSKTPTNICYRCGQEGHMERSLVAPYKLEPSCLFCLLIFFLLFIELNSLSAPFKI